MCIKLKKMGKLTLSAQGSTYDDKTTKQWSSDILVSDPSPLLKITKNAKGLLLMNDSLGKAQYLSKQQKCFKHSFLFSPDY